MKQLTLGVIISMVNEMRNGGMSTEDIYKLPIYIGNDDELNGIHTAWFGQVIDVGNGEDTGFVEMINEDYHNIKLNGKAILIS